MNRVTLIGRLTKNPELRYTNDNKPFVRLTLAIDRGKTKDGTSLGTDFINCFARNNKAEAIAKYVKKGEKFGISGRIRTSSYERQDGTKSYLTEVSIDEMEFLKPKEKVELPEPYNDAQPAEQSEDPFADFGEEVIVNPADLPF